MTNSGQTLYFLFIDDNMDYAESLNATAFTVNQGNPELPCIKLKWFSNLDDGKEFFETLEGRDISAVILDINCQKTKDGRTDQSFIMAAHSYFTQKAPLIPKAIITGQTDLYDNAKAMFEGTTPVYQKGRDEKELLQHLRGLAGALQRNIIIQKHQEALSIIRERLGRHIYEEFLAAFEKIYNEDSFPMVGILNSLRKVLERSLIFLNEINEEYVPRNFIIDNRLGNTKLEFSKILNHLRGNYDRINQTSMSTIHIPFYTRASSLLEFIYRECSKSSHARNDSDLKEDPPNRYTLLMLAYGIMDLMLWLEENLFSKKPPA